MKKTAKILKILSAGIIILSLLSAVGVLLASCTQSDGAVLECNRHDVSTDLHSIRIETLTSDIKLLPSDDASCHVECLELSRAKHDVTVSDGELAIIADDRRTPIDQVTIPTETPHIYVYLPRSEYTALAVIDHTGKIDIEDEFKFESIDITSSTGAVSLCGITAESVDITAKTGAVKLDGAEIGRAKIEVTTGTVRVVSLTCRGELGITTTTGETMAEDVTCGSFRSEGSTGGITLRRVTAAGEMKITRKTGGVIFEGSDAAEIDVETTTGSVRGSLLSGKTFTVTTKTGKIELPQRSSGAPCRISTTTGGINITVED